MSQLGDLLRDGRIRPLDVIKTYDIAELEQAMIYFSSELRIGKVVVTFSNPESLLKVSVWAIL